MTIAPQHPTAPAGLGRHRRPDPAGTQPRRTAAAVESTRAMSAAARRRDELGARASRLPAPTAPGMVIRHPATGAVAVACNPRGGDRPMPNTPCFAVVTGHDQHRDLVWLSYPEACAQGFELAGDLRDLL